MQKFGIDISLYQKGMDMDKALAEGVEFAILRGGVHLGKDSCFEDFYAACKARNIPVGVYLYSYATTVAAAKQEADFLIEKVLKGKQFEYPIYMDVETRNQKKAGKAVMTQVVIAFCEAIKAAGYLPGIYASLGFFKSYLDDSQLPYEKWVAQWAKKCQYTGDLGMWQFGGKTNYLRTNKIAGMVCDQDYCYKDYPAIIKAQGLNGFEIMETPDVVEKEETRKNITLLAQEVLVGKWGNGTARKEKLTAAGYNYTAVQAEVNRILKGKKTSYEIAQEVIIGKWGNGAMRRLRLTAAGYSASTVQSMVNEILKEGR